MQDKEISTILLVDDIPDNIYLLELILHSKSYKTISAKNGAEAVEIAANTYVDLILMDVMMPVMDGFEASQKLREMENTAHIPIILITAKKRDQGDILRGLDEGAIDYLSKPFNDEELLARVKSTLRIKHLNDKNRQLLKEVTRKNKLFEQELKMAEAVQKQLLPSEEELNRFSGYNVKSHYVATSSIGGDIYDIFDYGNGKVAFMMADVTGHGPSAALIMALVKALIISEVSSTPSPLEMARFLNEKLIHMTPDSHFITLFYGVADSATKTIRYVTAGHPAPYIISKSRDVATPLEITGALVGLFPNDDQIFKEQTIQWQAGDKLIMFTDGVFEMRNSEGEMYGLDRLKALLEAEKDSSLDDGIQAMVNEVESYISAKYERDDIALLGIEFE